MQDKKPKFHKVYTNPALGYYKDKSKPIEFEFVPLNYPDKSVVRFMEFVNDGIKAFNNN